MPGREREGLGKIYKFLSIFRVSDFWAKIDGASGLGSKWCGFQHLIGYVFVEICLRSEVGLVFVGRLTAVPSTCLAACKLESRTKRTPTWFR